MQYIVRDHDLAAFELRKKELQHIQAVLNGRYGEGTVELTITEQYRNMSEKIMPHFHLIENAKAAARHAYFLIVMQLSLCAAENCILKRTDSKFC